MQRNESGNALFMILIGVVLFAALAFTFTKGSQQGGESISIRQSELATSDIISFGQRVSRTIDGMLRQGKSETQISFEGLNTYTNAACTDDSCKVFVAAGKGIQPVYPLETWLDRAHSADYSYMNWYISAQFCVPGLPDNTCAAPKGNDLVMVLPYVKRDLCVTINNKLGIPNPPPTPSNFGSVAGAAQFDGSFSPAGGATLWDAAVLNGKSAGCLFDAGSGSYYFYDVLMQR
jgi:hypothetical protein